MTTLVVSTTAQHPIPYELLLANSIVLQNAPVSKDEGNILVPKELQIPFDASKSELENFANCLKPPCRCKIQPEFRKTIGKLADFLEIEWLRIKASPTLLDEFRKMQDDDYPSPIEQVFLQIKSWLRKVYNDGKSSAIMLVGEYRGYEKLPGCTHFPLGPEWVQKLQSDDYLLLNEICLDKFGIAPTDLKTFKNYNGLSILFKISWKDLL